MFGFGKTPLILAMGLFHSCADLIFPSFLQSAMIHEKSGICPNPAFPIKAQPPAGDDQMDVGMPLHEQSVFNFIVQLVQGFVLILRYLLSLPATEIAGVKFTAGPTGDVPMIQVFFQTTPAIAFRNITGYTMGCVDAIGSNFFQFERKIGKYVTR
jgi:hypothetical protein